jgi:hypothetical protein
MTRSTSVTRAMTMVNNVIEGYGVVSSRVVALGGQIGAEAPRQIGVVRLGVLLAHRDARRVMAC